MTVSSSTNKAAFVGDGIETDFPYAFRVDNDSDMEVYVEGLLIGSGYAVDREPDDMGGKVVFSAAPAVGEDVTLLRVLPLSQETDYTPYDSFPAQSHEDALDKLTMVQQQQQEEINRNSQAIGETPGVDTTAPPFEANKAWKWGDASEKKIINSTYDPDEQVSLAEGFADASALSASDASVALALSQKVAWESEAEAMTSDSYATEAHTVLVKEYVSNNDGTFTGTDVPGMYSSLHYSIEAAGAGGVPEAPNDGDPYVRVSLGWILGITKSVFDATVALLASKVYVDTQDGTLQTNINLKAPLASPVLTGNPQAPTPADNSLPGALATTQYVEDNGLSDGSVTTIKLADDAVTSAKTDIDEMQVAGLLPTAWCTFDGTLTGTNAPIAGYNVASVTRDSLGSYVINFFDNMDITSYCVPGAGQGNTMVGIKNPPSTNRFASYFNLEVRSGNSLSYDANPISILVFGGKT